MDIKNITDGMHLVSEVSAYLGKPIGCICTGKQEDDALSVYWHNNQGQMIVSIDFGKRELAYYISPECEIGIEDLMGQFAVQTLIGMTISNKFTIEEYIGE